VKNKSGIYSITNKINGRRYVGSAVNLGKRKNEHFSALRREGHTNAHLQNAYNKHGRDAFEFKVLEYCPRKPRLISLEQKWMGKLNPEYNISPVAGSQLGHRHTAKTKSKISKTSMGNTSHLGHKHTAEAKAKMSAAKKGKNLGRKHTAEAKAKFRGEKHGMSKLTREQVLDIRSRIDQLQTELAEEFGVSRKQIRNIQTGKQWGWLKSTRR